MSKLVNSLKGVRSRRLRQESPDLTQQAQVAINLTGAGKFPCQRTDQRCACFVSSPVARRDADLREADAPSLNADAEENTMTVWWRG